MDQCWGTVFKAMYEGKIKAKKENEREGGIRGAREVSSLSQKDF